MIIILVNLKKKWVEREDRNQNDRHTICSTVYTRNHSDKHAMYQIYMGQEDRSHSDRDAMFLSTFGSHNALDEHGSKR